MKTRFYNVPEGQKTSLRQLALKAMNRRHPTPQEFTYYSVMNRYVANIDGHEFVISRDELHYWWYQKNTERCVVFTVKEEWAQELVGQLTKSSV